MSAQDQARYNIAEQRHQAHNRQQSALERSEAEIAARNGGEIQEEARESLTQQRRAQANRKRSMQQRSEAEIT
ncbi:MAG: hypothetical protein ACFBSG_08280 [Leptolyngbyaceae cyanobacterium]